jgi:hypothetical protein
MFENDNLRHEGFDSGRGTVADFSTEVASLDVLGCEPTNIEADLISRFRLEDFKLEHLDGFDGGLEHCGGKLDLRSFLQSSRSYFANHHGPYASNHVDILDGQSERQLRMPCRFREGVKCLKRSWSFVPGHFFGLCG